MTLLFTVGLACASEHGSPLGESTDGSDTSAAPPMASSSEDASGDVGETTQGDACGESCDSDGEQLWRAEIDPFGAPDDATFHVSLADDEIVTSLAWQGATTRIHRLGRHGEDGELLWELDHPEQAEVVGEELLAAIGLANGRMLGAFFTAGDDFDWIRLLNSDGTIYTGIGGVNAPSSVLSLAGGSQSLFFTAQSELTGLTLHSYELSGEQLWAHQDLNADALTSLAPFGAGLVAFERRGPSGVSVVVLDADGITQLDQDFELLFGLAAAGEEVFVHHVGKVTRLALDGDAQSFDVPTTFVDLTIAGNGDVLAVHAVDDDGSALVRYSRDLEPIWEVPIAGAAQHVLERPDGVVIVGGSAQDGSAPWWISAHRP